MVKQVEFSLQQKRRGVHLVTDEITRALPPLPDYGILHLFIKHTSAAISINENADPSVRYDLNQIIDQVFPENQSFYTHTLEGDDDMPAHAKASFIGNNLSIPITKGRLNMGNWQGIYLCEFRNYGGARRIVATITG